MSTTIICNWIERAACRTTTIEFVPPPGDPNVMRRLTQAAKAVCATCPAVEACLRWAIEHDEVGVWGGTTSRERSALSGRRAAPEPVGRGMPPKAPEAIVIREVLADEQWHHRDELVDAVLGVLTEDRARMHASTGGRSAPSRVDDEVRLTAARAAVSNVMSYLVSSKQAERTRDRRYRFALARSCGGAA